MRFLNNHTNSLVTTEIYKAILENNDTSAVDIPRKCKIGKHKLIKLLQRVLSNYLSKAYLSNFTFIGPYVLSGSDER